MSALGDALLASAGATFAVAACERIEGAVLGERPRFSPDVIAGQLAKKRLHRRLDGRERALAGLGLRAAYGPTWGASFLLAPRLVRRHPTLAGAALGLAVCGFERVALPLTGATAALSRWSPLERSMLVGQTLVFGVAAALLFRRFGPRA